MSGSDSLLTNLTARWLDGETILAGLDDSSMEQLFPKLAQRLKLSILNAHLKTSIHTWVETLLQIGCSFLSWTLC